MELLFEKEISVRWADMDPNFHLRHSAYYDFCAQHRLEILDRIGLSLELFQKEHIGPVLFREECIFRREIRFSDRIRLTTRLESTTPDGSRWTIKHQLTKEEGTLCATIIVDGAWMDTKQRKLARPVPEFIVTGMEKFPKTTDSDVE